jgi:hypothetical protein
VFGYTGSKKKVSHEKKYLNQWYAGNKKNILRTKSVTIGKSCPDQQIVTDLED